MIILPEEYKKNPEALKQRRAYVVKLMDEPRPSASPSSQEWVSAEHWAGRYQNLSKEVREIDEQLQLIARGEK